MDPNSQYPEFNRKTDRVLVTLMLCTFLMPLMYAFPSYYMFDWMTYIWIPVSALLSVGVYFLGRGVQRFWAKTIRFPKPEFDPDKTTRDYIQLKKTLLRSAPKGTSTKSLPVSTGWRQPTSPHCFGLFPTT